MVLFILMNVAYGVNVCDYAPSLCDGTFMTRPEHRPEVLGWLLLSVKGVSLSVTVASASGVSVPGGGSA